MGAIDTQKNLIWCVVTIRPETILDYLTVNQRSFAGIRTRGNVQTSRETKFRDVISKLFPQTMRPREFSLHYGNTGRGTDMAGKLYYDPKRPAASRP